MNVKNPSPCFVEQLEGLDSRGQGRDPKHVRQIFQKDIELSSEDVRMEGYKSEAWFNSRIVDVWLLA